jgi:hypothetical protein
MGVTPMHEFRKPDGPWDFVKADKIPGKEVLDKIAGGSAERVMTQAVQSLSSMFSSLSPTDRLRILGVMDFLPREDLRESLASPGVMGSLLYKRAREDWKTTVKLVELGLLLQSESYRESVTYLERLKAPGSRGSAALEALLFLNSIDDRAKACEFLKSSIRLAKDTQSEGSQVIPRLSIEPDRCEYLSGIADFLLGKVPELSSVEAQLGQELNPDKLVSLFGSLVPGSPTPYFELVSTVALLLDALKRQQPAASESLQSDSEEADDGSGDDVSPDTESTELSDVLILLSRREENQSDENTPPDSVNHNYLHSLTQVVSELSTLRVRLENLGIQTIRTQDLIKIYTGDAGFELDMIDPLIRVMGGAAFIIARYPTSSHLLDPKFGLLSEFGALLVDETAPELFFNFLSRLGLHLKDPSVLEAFAGRFPRFSADKLKEQLASDHFPRLIERFNDFQAQAPKSGNAAEGALELLRKMAEVEDIGELLELEQEDLFLPPFFSVLKKLRLPDRSSLTPNENKQP